MKIKLISRSIIIVFMAVIYTANCETMAEKDNQYTSSQKRCNICPVTCYMNQKWENY